MLYTSLAPPCHDVFGLGFCQYVFERTMLACHMSTRDFLRFATRMARRPACRLPPYAHATNALFVFNERNNGITPLMLPANANYFLISDAAISFAGRGEHCRA